jgi:hypothetical protein
MKIIEVSQISAEEKVYLKKDFLGYRVVYPIKNEDGTINWFHLIFGSWSNIVFLIILALIITVFYLGVNELISNYKLVADNPCNFCKDCFEQTRSVLSGLNTPHISSLNLSNIIPT